MEKLIKQLNKHIGKDPLMTKEEKAELDRFIDYAVGEGCLDIDQAKNMSYFDKADYFDKCEAMAYTDDAYADYKNEAIKELKAM